MATFYADAVGNISLTEGVVRIDLLNYTKVDGDQATLAVNMTLAMSLPALVRTQQNLKSTVEKMLEQGILKKEEDALKQ